MIHVNAYIGENAIDKPGTSLIVRYEYSHIQITDITVK